MERGDFLSISPTELKFPFELKKQSSCTLQLTNETYHSIAFKVKTTNPKKYGVRPNMVIIFPGTPCNVTVSMQAQKEFPFDMQCKDKFLVQSVVVSTGATAEDITSEIFNKEPGKVVKEFKLRVIYVLANLSGSSSRATMDDLGVSSKDLFSIHPMKLYFPFELNKQNSCHVQLTSKTEQHIAFKGQQSSDEELVDVTDDYLYVTKDSAIDDAELGQQRSDEELVDVTDDYVYVTKDSSIDDAELGQQRSDEELVDVTDDYVYVTKDSSIDDAELGQQSSNEELVDVTDDYVYVTKDSSIDDAEVSQQSSNEELVDVTDDYVYVTKDSSIDDAELGGHTFTQNAGFGDSRQYQAGNVSGGTVNQGDVPFAGGGAANMEDDG